MSRKKVTMRIHEGGTKKPDLGYVEIAYLSSEGGSLPEGLCERLGRQLVLAAADLSCGCFGDEAPLGVDPIFMIMSHAPQGTDTPITIFTLFASPMLVARVSVAAIRAFVSGYLDVYNNFGSRAVS